MFKSYQARACSDKTSQIVAQSTESMLVFADRIVMAAAGLLGAAAACVILLSFAAGHRKSLHQGCHSDLSADFLDFGAGDFPFKISFKKCFKNLFLLWRQDPALELQFLTPLLIVRRSIVFCNSVCADRIVMAASGLLGAAAACVILLSFAAGNRKS